MRKGSQWGQIGRGVVKREWGIMYQEGLDGMEDGVQGRGEIIGKDNTKYLWESLIETKYCVNFLKYTQI